MGCLLRTPAEGEAWNFIYLFKLSLPRVNFHAMKMWPPKSQDVFKSWKYSNIMLNNIFCCFGCCMLVFYKFWLISSNHKYYLYNLKGFFFFPTDIPSNFGLVGRENKKRHVYDLKLVAMSRCILLDVFSRITCKPYLSDSMHSWYIKDMC